MNDIDPIRKSMSRSVNRRPHPIRSTPLPPRHRGADRFFGRAEERDWLRHELDAVGRVVIVGPPGIGKSRLAREVAAETGARLLDDPALEDPALADEGATDRLLIVSRQRLHLPAVRCLELGPLELDDALALLVDRADLGAPSGAARDDLRAIVTLLEGNPLALELVAPRIPLIGANALRVGLERGEDLVTARRAPEGARWRSMTDAIASSWDHATEIEREALMRFSVFAAPFDLEAAHAIYGDLAARASLLGVLESLRDRSLLAVSPERRYSLTGSLRIYARRRAPPSVYATARALHRAHHLHGATAQAFIQSRFDPRLPRAELERIYRDALAAEPPDTETAKEALLVLRPLLLAHGPFDEALRRVQALMPSDDPRLLILVAELEIRRGSFEAAREPLVRARALAVDPHLQVFVLSTLGGLERTDVSLALFAEARRILDTHPEPRLEALLSEQLGVWLMHQEDLQVAERHLERALFVVRAENDVRAAAYVLGFLATCRLARGAHEGAIHAARESIALSLSLDDRRWAACGMGVLGLVALERGEASSARAHLTDALVELRALDNPWLEALMRLGLAELALSSFDLPTARAQFERVLEVERARGEVLTTTWALGGLTAVAARQDEPLEAAARLEEARAISREYAPMMRALDMRARELAVAEVRREMQADRGDPARLSEIGEGLLEAQRRERPFLLRVAARMVEAEIERVAERCLPTLRMIDGGEAFAIGAGVPVSLARRPRLRNLLAGLVAAHAERPSAWLSIEELFALGWPNERALASAATNRVHVTLTRLRKLGVEAVIESGPEGVRVRRGVVVRSM